MRTCRSSSHWSRKKTQRRLTAQSQTSLIRKWVSQIQQQLSCCHSWRSAILLMEWWSDINYLKRRRRTQDRVRSLACSWIGQWDNAMAAWNSLRKQERLSHASTCWKHEDPATSSTAKAASSNSWTSKNRNLKHHWTLQHQPTRKWNSGLKHVRMFCLCVRAARTKKTAWKWIGPYVVFSRN